jgi:hypothetical protein
MPYHKGPSDGTAQERARPKANHRDARQLGLRSSGALDLFQEYGATSA